MTEGVSDEQGAYCLHEDCLESLDTFTDDELERHQRTAHATARDDNAQGQDVPRGCRELWPEDLGAEDLADRILTACEVDAAAGSGSMFKRLRRDLHGDGTLHYRVEKRSERVMRLSRSVWDVMEQVNIHMKMS